MLAYSIQRITHSYNTGQAQKVAQYKKVTQDFQEFKNIFVPDLHKHRILIVFKQKKIICSSNITFMRNDFPTVKYLTSGRENIMENSTGKLWYFPWEKKFPLT
jgi:hypothetical protein